MSQWSLYNEATSSSNNDKFNVYRCVNPTAVTTEQPWYSYSNVCPCDPKLSNTSGRGYTPCPFGVLESNDSMEMSELKSQFRHQEANQFPSKHRLVGNLDNTLQFTPPQLQPRQLVRIGQVWRDKN